MIHEKTALKAPAVPELVGLLVDDAALEAAAETHSALWPRSFVWPCFGNDAPQEAAQG